VIRATIGELDHDYQFNGPILAPGFGEQGGTVADLVRIFGTARGQVLPSSSRGMVRPGPDVHRLRDNALAMRDQLAALA